LLKFQLDRTCFERGEVGGNFDVSNNTVSASPTHTLKSMSSLWFYFDWRWRYCGAKSKIIEWDAAAT